MPEWRTHLLERLRHQAAVTADSDLGSLLAELRSYPASQELGAADHAAIAVPLRLAVKEYGTLSSLSTTTVFGTPMDVTLSELFVEALLPADAVTAEALRDLVARKDVRPHSSGAVPAAL